MSIQSIGIMGLGYIGLPTSITFALAGYTVRGFDVNQTVVDTLNSGRIHIVEPGLQEAFDRAAASGRLNFSTSVPACDAYIITVQTPHRQDEQGRRVSDVSYVRSAASMIAPVLREGCLVVLESTVPPMTTRMVEDILEQGSGLNRDRFYTAHCPERVIPGRILDELKNNDRIIGARLPEAAELARQMYQKVLDKGVIRVADDITAEMCKLTENTFRDINIAYANELSVVCDKLGIDVFRLIELANCHPRVNIHTPGVGVGGHCIAVDPWFIHEKFEKETPLIYTARTVNDGKPGWVADKVASLAPAGAKVCVLGLAYKPDIDDLRESPSVALCRILQQRGFTVCACEPNVAADEVRGIPVLPLEKAVEQSDFLVITLQHTPFKSAKALISTRPYYDCVGLMR